MPCHQRLTDLCWQWQYKRSLRHGRLLPLREHNQRNDYAELPRSRKSCMIALSIRKYTPFAMRPCVRSSMFHHLVPTVPSTTLIGLFSLTALLDLGLFVC